jgi:predicted RNA-binding protein with PUA-like domain
MPQQVTDEAFGAWLLKSNPDTWDLEAFVADGNRSIDRWSVQNNYRSDRMRLGDPVVFWVTGKQPTLPPGVWGVGHVTGSVYEEVEEVEEVEADDGDALDYWRDPEARAKAVCFVPVETELRDRPVPRQDIQSVPVLADAEVFRVPQLGNPNYLTKSEWAALQQLVGPVAAPSSGDLARWSDEDTIRQLDPVTRAVVEEAAVEYVIEALSADGWTVDDVQPDRVGWDLTARRGDTMRCIEVKGRGTGQRAALLTANEVRAARDQPGRELALVSNALAKPELTWHTAATVTAAATPVLFRCALP